jgi:hypothetical protein
MSRNNLIVWEKWIDPFEKEEPLPEEDIDDINNLDEEQILPNHHMIPTKAIITPIGIMPLQDLNMSEIFNFWIGHTNFNLTKDVAGVIEQSDGVEVLDIITRYRFRIGIGKIFTDRDVMKQINDNVYEFIDKYYD